MKNNVIYWTILALIVVWIGVTIEYNGNYFLIGGLLLIILIFAAFFSCANKYDVESKNQKTAVLEAKIKKLEDNYKRFDEAEFQKELIKLRSECKVQEIQAELECKKLNTEPQVVDSAVPVEPKS